MKHTKNQFFILYLNEKKKQMTHYLTSETDYFRPLDPSRIQDCILDVSLHTTENTERFHLEIYSEYVQTVNIDGKEVQHTYRRVPHPSFT